MSPTRKLFLFLALLLVLIFALVMFWLANQSKTSVSNSQEQVAENNNQSNKATTAKVIPKGEPTKLKSIGFNLGHYDAATKTAGDIKFTKLTQPNSEIWVDFGIQDFRSPNDPKKRNVQPTFILPLKTKVLSLVDGTVSNVEKLYSNDYSIMVTTNGSSLVYETEHVINPLVKVGDKVTAGQVIAEVSTHDSQYHPGF